MCRRVIARHVEICHVEYHFLPLARTPAWGNTQARSTDERTAAGRYQQPSLFARSETPEKG